MSRRARLTLALLAVLTLGGLLWPAERPAHEANSFGVVPGGYRALFELLVELGLPVERSYAAAAALEPEAVVWWIEPAALCDVAAEAPPDAGEAGRSLATDGAWQPGPWLTAGGTAVVFLASHPRWTSDGGPPRLQVEPGCTRLAGFALPPRTGDLAPEPAPDDDAAAADGEAGPEAPGMLDRWWRGELANPERPEAEIQSLEGGLVPRPRRLESEPLRRFAEAAPGGWEVRASLAGLPFVLERGVGQGRLVVVADGRFLSNRWLDRGDAAPFALDLARAYGVPRIDERSHGLRSEQRTLVYLAGSPARPVFLGLALLGLLALWLGTALPRRRADGDGLAPPTLAHFVASLGSLYARTRDHGRVARRYRDLCLAQLRRHFALPPDTPDRVLLARLRRHARVSGETAAVLAQDGLEAIRSSAELRVYARRLDACVEEICS